MPCAVPGVVQYFSWPAGPLQITIAGSSRDVKFPPFGVAFPVNFFRNSTHLEEDPGMSCVGRNIWKLRAQRTPLDTQIPPEKVF